MNERLGQITAQGNPLTLLGDEVKIGDKAPDFSATANDMTQVEFSSLRGKTVILSVVPSLDTSVCAVQTSTFSKAAQNFGPDIVVLTISMDLPFAQSRWCEANDVTNVQTVSDYKERTFGSAYGVLIKELKLLARSVFIVDKEGIIRYIQIVKEVTTEPDYDDVLKALEQVTL